MTRANGNGRNGNGAAASGQPRLPITDMLDRQPPYDLKAEMSILGSAILLPEILDDAALILRPEDFYDDANRKLYEHFVALHEDGKRIDSTLLIDRLKTSGEFEAVGGAAYLSRLINAVPNAAHARYYSEIVRDKATYRALILKATELLRDAYDELQSAHEMVGRAESDFAQVAEGIIAADAMPDFSAAVIQAMASIEARSENQMAGIATGCSALDHATNGLKAGELTIIGGRPSQGKSSCAMGIALHVARHTHAAVLFVSLEMRRSELVERALAGEARISFRRMQRNDLRPEERSTLVNRCGELSHLRLFIDDHPARGVSEITAEARKLKRKHGLAIVIIDYVQLVEPDNHKDPREQQVSKIARRLKKMARELEAPVVCLAQLNRQVDSARDYRPRLSMLRESGSLEQDSDNVVFVHRPLWYKDEHPKDGSGEEAEWIIAKNRNGPTEVAKMMWFGQWMRWENPAPAYQQSSAPYSAPYSDGGF